VRRRGVLCEACEPDLARLKNCAREQKAAIALRAKLPDATLLKYQVNVLTRTVEGIQRTRRVDIRIQCPKHDVVVEVDEYQHAWCTERTDAISGSRLPRPRNVWIADRKRELDIQRTFGRPTVFIRFNPDAEDSAGAMKQMVAMAVHAAARRPDERLAVFFVGYTVPQPEDTKLAMPGRAPPPYYERFDPKDPTTAKVRPMCAGSPWCDRVPTHGKAGCAEHGGDDAAKGRKCAWLGCKRTVSRGCDTYCGEHSQGWRCSTCGQPAPTGTDLCTKKECGAVCPVCAPLPDHYRIEPAGVGPRPWLCAGTGHGGGWACARAGCVDNVAHRGMHCERCAKAAGLPMGRKAQYTHYLLHNTKSFDLPGPRTWRTDEHGYTTFQCGTMLFVQVCEGICTLPDLTRQIKLTAKAAPAALAAAYTSQKVQVFPYQPSRGRAATICFEPDLDNQDGGMARREALFRYALVEVANKVVRNVPRDVALPTAPFLVGCACVLIDPARFGPQQGDAELDASMAMYLQRERARAELAQLATMQA
jgi:hypothetical protein